MDNFSSKENLKSISKKQSYDYNLIAMCWHESSHAICALLNYMKVVNIFVMDGKETSGRTDYEHYIYFDNLKNKSFFKYIIMGELQTCYAGLMGEKLYYKKICGSDKFPMHLRIGSYSDIYDASNIIRKYNLSISGKERYEFKKKVQNDVYNLLLEHWDAVEIIAHALYKKRKLKFDDLNFLLTKKTSNNSFWKEKFKKINYIHNNINISEKDLGFLLLKDI